MTRFSVFGCLALILFAGDGFGKGAVLPTAPDAPESCTRPSSEDPRCWSEADRRDIEAKKLRCARPGSEIRLECIPIRCEEKPAPLDDDEFIVTYGKRAVALIGGGKWRELGGGGRLHAVDVLYPTGKSRAGIPIRYVYALDDIDDSCVTLAAANKGKLASNRFYASKPGVRFRYELDAEEKKRFEKAVCKCDVQCRAPKVYGVSDLDQDGAPEVWYPSSDRSCGGIRVLRLSKESSSRILEFTYCRQPE